MLRSASSMSTMEPAFTPRDFCQPKPSARGVPSLSIRAIRQTTLVEPISSTPNTPEARAAEFDAARRQLRAGRIRF